ncbi:hypothetical protein WR25_17709 [Diploscapter pachys]|uniref:Uncharacterized protein n=1 Tax=Diploscapter pachys TaxID=2018661 RepID=A0A2A2L9K8_9BILA|nr:hypothetical protein WR25_17709 [Diploscapter pachys]
MLYPKEDKEHRQLLYACRNCDHKQVSDNPCIYVNKLMHEVDELTQIVADVIHDPTLPKTEDHPCKKCGHGLAVFFQAQSRRAEQMLRQKALVEVLKQVNSDEIYGSLLANRDGLILASVGLSDVNVYGSLLAGIWDTFDRTGDNPASREELKDTVVMCEDGMIAAQRVANMLIAIKASRNAPLGTVRSRLSALAKYLEEPLSKLASSN